MFQGNGLRVDARNSSVELACCASTIKETLLLDERAAGSANCVEAFKAGSCCLSEGCPSISAVTENRPYARLSKYNCPERVSTRLKVRRTVVLPLSSHS